MFDKTGMIRKVDQEPSDKLFMIFEAEYRNNIPCPCLLLPNPEQHFFYPTKKWIMIHGPENPGPTGPVYAKLETTTIPEIEKIYNCSGTQSRESL